MSRNRPNYAKSYLPPGSFPSPKGAYEAAVDYAITFDGLLAFLQMAGDVQDPTLRARAQSHWMMIAEICQKLELNEPEFQETTIPGACPVMSSSLKITKPIFRILGGEDDYVRPHG